MVYKLSHWYRQRIVSELGIVPQVWPWGCANFSCVNAIYLKYPQ